MMVPEQISLQNWQEALNRELGDFSLDEESTHILLDLARDASHHVVRPASPLTMFTVGYLVGRGASLGATAAHLTEQLLDAETESPGAAAPDPAAAAEASAGEDRATDRAASPDIAAKGHSASNWDDSANS